MTTALLIIIIAYFLISALVSIMDVLTTGKAQPFYSPAALYRRIANFIRLQRREKTLKRIRLTTKHPMGIARTVKAVDLTADDFEIGVRDGAQLGVRICSSCFFQSDNQGRTMRSAEPYKTLVNQMYDAHIDSGEKINGSHVGTGDIVFLLKAGINVEY